MPLIRCPHCRTELDVPQDWLGESISCSDCQREFIAAVRPTARRIVEDEDDRPRRRRPAYDEDDRPRRRSKKTGGGKTVWFVLGGVGLLVLLVCGGGGIWFATVFNKPMTFAESAWHDHSLPDGGAAVQVPVTLHSEPVPLQGGFGVSAHKDIWEASGIKDAAFVFGVIDCPLDNPSTLDEVYRDERDEVLSMAHARIVSERSLTVQGCPAKEFEFAANGAHGVYRIVYLQERTRKRFILIMAGGRNMSVADRTKFLDSFRIKNRK